MPSSTTVKKVKGKASKEKAKIDSRDQCRRRHGFKVQEDSVDFKFYFDTILYSISIHHNKIESNTLI